MREQIVLRFLAMMIIPFILIFGFYVITHGEIGPGGGFQGGVILASAFILYSLIYGVKETQRVIPRRVLEYLVALGILLYAGIGILGLLGGKAFLDYSVLGSTDGTAAESLGVTLVEYGVGITVAAVMVTIFNMVAEKHDGSQG